MPAQAQTTEEAIRDPMLLALGKRVRGLRARRGVTRKVLAQIADVSERHLASLESGEGNPSVLVLRQVASALGCSMAELLGDETTGSPDWLLLRELLHDRSPAELATARQKLAELFDQADLGALRTDRIALIGLRGAGKSTLAKLLAEKLKRPFIELNHEIERQAGCKPEQIHTMYGPVAYRRHERRALDEILIKHSRAVISTPGGIVSETSTFNILLSRCYTIWLKASPEEHMDRVIAQGDMRPMAGNREAMDDLKMILKERTPFYAKADLAFDTSGKTLDRCFSELFAVISQAIA